VIIDYKVSSALIPKEVIRQILPLELFKQLLELLKPDIDTTEDFIKMQDPNIDDSSIMVQPVQFPSFDEQSSMQLEGNKNFNLLLDIKLKLTVELGRAELPIKRVLELTRGSIIELDKIAGEPVELYANNKLVARGEVVVIEDNFGLRITNIISPDDRIKNL
jgi:flagellar motor switch protein FliN/FliY